MGAPNSANPALGIAQAPAAPAMTGQAKLEEIAKYCDKHVSPNKKTGGKKSCLKLGSDKHACAEGKVQEHRKKNPQNGNPELEGERGYRRPALNSNNRPAMPLQAPQPTGGARPNLRAAFQAGGAAIGQAFAALRGNCFPDAAILGPNGEKTFADFKFPCPPGHPVGKKGISKGGSRPTMSPRQQGSYDALGLSTGGGTTVVISP